jgi:hypothetical protein
MRLVVCVLACVAAGGMALALADPPANPAPTAAAAPQATQPATSATAPAASAPAAQSPQAATTTVDVDAQREQMLEKRYLAEGYKLEMHNGEKLFCRREEELGSRLGGQKVCSTAQQLEFTEEEAKAAIQRGNTQQNNPSGR